MKDDERSRMQVHVGDTFDLKNCYRKTGISNGKDGKEHSWVFFAPLDENGTRRFTLFAVNGEEAARFTGTIKVKEIISAKMRVQRGRDNPDRWYHDLVCDCIIEGTNENAFDEAKAAEEFEAFLGF